MIRDIQEKNESTKPQDFEIEKLRQALPEYFDRDGHFLMDKFQEALSTRDVDISKEGFELKFLGKSYAKFLTSTATETFISPDLEHNALPENKDSENMYIVGDNLDALKHLLGSYAGKLKCIYIDPPYNTGSDGFVYNDDFGFTAKQLQEKIGLSEDEAERVIDLQGKSSHSAWMTFMYPRLQLARELLSEDGVIFISIDDNELHTAGLLCDEIFGESNALPRITWESKTKSQNTKTARNRLQPRTESILVYKKQDTPKNFALEVKGARSYPLEDERGMYRNYFVEEMASSGVRGRETMIFPILGIEPKSGQQWQLGKGTIESFQERGDLEIVADRPCLRMRPDDEDANTYHPFWSHLFEKDIYGTAESANLELKKYFGTKDVFDTVKPVRLVKSLIGHMRGVEDDKSFYVLDFFSGSATTAEAVLDLNANEKLDLKYILVQLEDVIDEGKVAHSLGFDTIDQIGRERIKRAAVRIKEKTSADTDYGFKLFRTAEPSEKSIDQLYEFDPAQQALFEEDYVSKFGTDEASGKDVILTTWLNQDGFGLNAKPRQLALAGYRLDVCEDSAYVVEPGLTSDDVVELVRLVETGELDVSRVVVFGYSVKFNVMHELKKNMNVLKSGRNVTVVERL